MTVVLTPAVQLPEVVTRAQLRYLSPNLRGFEERRRIGATGYFISDSILRREESRPLGNVLRSHIPGINIEDGTLSNGRVRGMYLLKSLRCTVGGPPDVYLDGVRLMHPPPPPNAGPRRADGSIQPFDLSQFDVTNLAGVEYYPDQTMAPMAYNGTSKGCGVLLLWTREK